MESKNNFFIAIYTNSVKDYCDEEFFSAVNDLREKNLVSIIDNSTNNNYVKRLRQLNPYAMIEHIEVPVEPKVSQFQRNVCESVNKLRDTFLYTDKKYFLILESDVIPPKDLLNRFRESIDSLDFLEAGELDLGGIHPKWGALGALYYGGFHDTTLEGLHETHHVLSGCTVYRRELIEKYPFRYDPENLSAFPDALISYDASKEYTLWNDHGIICDHKHTPHGTRISRPL